MIYEDLGYDFGVQLLTLLYALIVGIALGVLFDLFRISRVFLSVPTGKRAARMLSDTVLTAVSFIEDITFFTVSACTLVLFLHSTNQGIGRGYLIFGAAVGFALYLVTVGRLTRLISAAVSRMLWRAVRFMILKMICPLLRFIRICGTRIYNLTAGRLIRACLTVYGKRKTDRIEQELCRAVCLKETNKKGTKDETASFFGTRKIYDSRIFRNTDISSGMGAG